MARIIRAAATEVILLPDHFCDRPIPKSVLLWKPPSSLAGFIFAALARSGSISAILRRQSASVSHGLETKVPLTCVLYHPDPTPSRIAFSLALDHPLSGFRLIGGHDLCSAIAGEPGKIRKHGRDQVAMMGVVRSEPRGV